MPLSSGETAAPSRPPQVLYQLGLKPLPKAAPLERCAELLDVDLATVGKLAAVVQPYLRADGTRIWSLMQLERQLHPEVCTAGAAAATSTADRFRPPIQHQSGRPLAASMVR